MSSPETFIDLVLHGDVVMDEIDDFVEAWHRSDSDETLHEFLGMTSEEYDLWVEKPESLPLILAAREDRLPVAEAIERYAEFEPVAARTAHPEAAKVVLAWLRNTGRI
jgi:hypothetical protein